MTPTNMDYTYMRLWRRGHRNLELSCLPTHLAARRPPCQGSSQFVQHVMRVLLRHVLRDAIGHADMLEASLKQCGQISAARSRCRHESLRLKPMWAPKRRRHLNWLRVPIQAPMLLNVHRHIHLHVQMHVHMHLDLHRSRCSYVYSLAHAPSDSYTYKSIYIFSYNYICCYKCSYIHSYMFICINTYISICISACTFICIHGLVLCVQTHIFEYLRVCASAHLRQSRT